MSVKVHLYSQLQTYTENKSIVEVEGNTVGQCLDDLIKKYPKIKPVLMDARGNLLSTVFVSVNLNSPKSEPANQPITRNDELYLILIVSGG